MRKTLVTLMLLLATPLMATITTTSVKTTYSANGSTTTFDFDWTIYDTSDIVVVHRITSTGVATTLTEVTDYTVTATNNDFSSGGTVTTTSTYASGITLTIKADIPETQEATLQDTKVLRLESLETAYDKITLLIQQHSEILARCFKIPLGESTTVEAASSVDRASATLVYDGSGNLSDEASTTSSSTSVSSFMETLLDDADAGTGRNTLGLVDVDSYADFETAISSIAATQTILHIYTSQAVAASTTVPSTLALVFHNGGDLTVAGSQVVTLNGPVLAGNYQIFAGAGTISFDAAIQSTGKWANVMWWGAKADSSASTTENGAIFDAALTALGNGGTLFIPGHDTSRHYEFSTGITISSVTNVKIYSDSTARLVTDTDLTILNIAGTSGIYLENLHFIGSDTTTNSNVIINGVTNVKITNCRSQDSSNHGWEFTGTCDQINLVGVLADSCTDDGFNFGASCTEINLIGCNSESNTGDSVEQTIPSLGNNATPTVSGWERFYLSGGTTTITDWDDGYTGMLFTMIAEHTLTITDGTNILLNGSGNFAMTATDTLTVLQKADGKWYEVSRGDNGA